MGEKKPTRGAKKRFESLVGLRPAKVLVDGGGSEGVESAIEGTVVDISTSCMCLRVPMDADDADLLQGVKEGDYIEVVVAESANRCWTVLGHLAWLWVPSMEKDDIVGSMGVDIAGVVEDDDRWVGKLRKLVSFDREIEVDRASRNIEIPAHAREKTARKDDDGASDGT